MNASPQAIAAVRAAKNLFKWGPFAALRYIEKRQVPLPLFAAAVDFQMRRGVAS